MDKDLIPSAASGDSPSSCVGVADLSDDLTALSCRRCDGRERDRKEDALQERDQAERAKVSIDRSAGLRLAACGYPAMWARGSG